jgi:hypothetical protein
MRLRGKHHESKAWCLVCEEAVLLTDRDTETPEDDAAEQQLEVVDPGEDDEELDDTPLEADPADAAEQKRAVSLGDDEYR